MGPLIMPSEDSEESVDWERDAGAHEVRGAPIRPEDRTVAIVVLHALRRATEDGARLFERLRRGGVLRRL